MNSETGTVARVMRGLALAGLALWLALLQAPPVEATNGYLIHGIGTRAKALAGAGVAMPLDALAAGSNPAGMAFVGKRYDLGMAIFNPNREYTVSGNPSGFPAFGLVPGTVESDSETFIVPNFGANWQIGPNSAFGLSVYGQGGMNTDYPTATFFGTAPTGVDLSQLFVVPTYAFKLGGGNSSIGISAILAYQTFEIQGVQAFAPFSSDPTKLSNNGHDDSTGYGFKLGYLGQWTQNFSFGVAYQGEVSMEEFSDYAGLFAEQGGFDIPGHYTVGIAYRFGVDSFFVLDYQEIAYSEIESVANPMLPNLFQAPLGAANGAGFGWEDMSVIKAGFQWGSGPWDWRIGFSTGDQPIPSTEVLFNILAPGVMEEHIALGFSRAFGTGKEFSLSIMHAPSVSVTGPNPLDPAQTIVLEMDQWDLEFGFSWGL